jgi:hypothetical protein
MLLSAGMLLATVVFIQRSKPRRRTMETTTGHIITIDRVAMTLTISGPTETMDAIPAVELAAAAREHAFLVDWARGPLDEVTYAVVQANSLADFFD